MAFLPKAPSGLMMPTDPAIEDKVGEYAGLFVSCRIQARMGQVM